MITILCGAPRSGKSTRALEYSKQPNTIIVCGDDIRKALTGDRFNEYSEDFVSAIKHTMIRVYHNRGMHVVVDGTHSTIGSISKILAIDPEANIEFVPDKAFYRAFHGMYYDLYSDGVPNPVINPTILNNVNILKQRAIETQQEDLIPVIERIHFQIYQLLCNDESDINELRKKWRKHKLHVV